MASSSPPFCQDPLLFDQVFEGAVPTPPLPPPLPRANRRGAAAAAKRMAASSPTAVKQPSSPRHGSSSAIFHKIGYLQALTMELVSRTDNSSQQQLREIERLVDQAMEGIGILQDAKPVLAAEDGATATATATATAASGSSSSSSFADRFGLDLLVFDGIEETAKTIFDPRAPKVEDGDDQGDEFMSYLMSDQDQDEGGGGGGAWIENGTSGGGGSGAARKEEIEDEAEALPPGSYDLIELDAMEILAEHTHFCDICGKGFKRDANLRMHMRGHGDEYKTAAALSKPKDTGAAAAELPRSKRYSCPFEGCKRHKLHPKFSPLKTVLCVKNHYRRSHCPKRLVCSKCRSKKFSVVADLRTHEKHCGREKWMCSCGTSFSRKDKLLGHVALFAGHQPLSRNSSASSSSAAVAVVIEGGGGGAGAPKFSEEQRFAAAAPASESWVIYPS